MHTTLGSDADDPAFCPEEPSAESLGLLTATIDEEIERIFGALPDDPALEPIAGRKEDVRERLSQLTRVGSVGRIIRHHGDYHLGQTLWADEDWTIIDFEGEPARSLPERRRKRSPLRDVAGMLRSFAYAASAARIQRGLEPPPGWEQRARREFLDAYLETVDPRLLPSGRDAIGRLLAIFELEKAVYELRYELNHRPDWVSIPVAGIQRLLEQEGVTSQCAAFDPHNPHGTLGAHEAKGGVVVRVFRPEATKVRVLPFEVELEAADGSGFFEGVVKGAELPLDYELEIAYPDGGVYTIARPVLVPADARRARPAPRRRGPARGARTTPPRRARARARRRPRRRVLGLGAERARGLGRRRLQRLGRPPAPAALARLHRRLGAVRARARTSARATSSRSTAPTASCA